jgi:hypothetical protein
MAVFNLSVPFVLTVTSVPDALQLFVAADYEPAPTGAVAVLTPGRVDKQSPGGQAIT